MLCSYMSLRTVFGKECVLPGNSTHDLGITVHNISVHFIQNKVYVGEP